MGFGWYSSSHSLEYEHAVSHLGKEHVVFTNFPRNFSVFDGTFERSCLDLFPLDRMCLLDSESKDLLRPSDSNEFDYFVVGGILGNGTLRFHSVVGEFDADKTRILRERGFRTRNLGSAQMTMDTAAIVCHMVVNRGVDFSSISFIDRPTIKVNRHERVKMNFRYLPSDTDPKKPLISATVLKIIKDTSEFNLDELE